jgi:hypothetical protein
MKTFIQTVDFRRGCPTMLFVSKERSASDRRCYNYWLGTYYDRITPLDPNMVFQGIGCEYNSVEKIAITKETYQALVKQAKHNLKKYKVK